MYLVQISTNVISQFSAVTFVMKNDVDGELIPYLSQSISPNEMTTLPSSGMYFAAIQGENITVLAPATFEEARALELKPFAVALAKADSKLGNGTGKAAQQEKDEKKAAIAGGRQISMWKAKATKLGLKPETVTADGKVEAADGKMVLISTL